MRETGKRQTEREEKVLICFSDTIFAIFITFSFIIMLTVGAIHHDCNLLTYLNQVKEMDRIRLLWTIN